MDRIVGVSVMGRMRRRFGVACCPIYTGLGRVVPG
jgi:hypothetical protein